MARKKVLWVDDEIEYLRSHIMFLETRGYSVTPVFSGDDAIHMLNEEPGKFDIVLLDEQMPGKDGLTTLVEIKDLDPNLPVVMVTKSEEEELMEEAMGRKIDGYLTKPVNPSQILLVCKNLLYSREIMSTHLKHGFVRNYSTNRELLQHRMGSDEWVELHKNLGEWDIKLESTKDEGIRQGHVGQKSDANKLFSEYIAANYMRWMQGEKNPPVFTPQVIDTYLKPHIESGEKVYFIVLDSLRVDHYILIQKLLLKYFHVKTHYYYSIIPSSTEITRTSLLSGLYPIELAEQYPEIWSGIMEHGTNIVKKEGKLLAKKLVSCGLEKNSHSEYVKLSDESNTQKIVASLDKFKDKQVVTFVVDFIDMFIRGSTTSRVLQDIAPDEAVFRKFVYSWFESSNLFEILKELSNQDSTVILTTSNGSNLCTRGTEVYGGGSSIESLRYRCGKKLTCDERFAYYIHEPKRFNLPQPEELHNYIVLKENYYFIDHDTYNNYNDQYHNTFQSGGISLDEMIVPLAVMKPRLFNL